MECKRAHISFQYLRASDHVKPAAEAANKRAVIATPKITDSHQPAWCTSLRCDEIAEEQPFDPRHSFPNKLQCGELQQQTFDGYHEQKISNQQQRKSKYQVRK